jgi:hypothetical protein
VRNEFFATVGARIIVEQRRRPESTQTRLGDRFIPEVEQHFTSSPLLAIRADDSDVKRFVAGQMYRLPRCVQRDNELQKTIKEGISMAVEGM